MKADSRKKARFFEKGVRAYQRFTGHPRPIYVCPTCQRDFNAEALKAGTLTLDHVPPESLGGKPIVLTCKDCNSTAGHTLDSALKTREDIRRFNQSLLGREGEYEGRARFEAAGVQLNVDLTVDASGLKVNVLSPINDPNDAKRLFEYFEKLAIAGKGLGEQYRITPSRRVHLQHSAVGELRAAYLAAFARLGYGYAFHPRLAAVRHQIQEPDRRIVTGTIVNETESSEPRLVLLREPLVALAVVFRFTSTILPWLTGPDNVYDELSNRYQPDQRIRVSGDDLRWPSTMELALDLDAD